MKKFKLTIASKEIHDDLKDVKIRSSSDIIELMRKVYDEDTFEIKESFKAFYLNRQNVVIGYADISEGTTTACCVDIKHVLKHAIDCNATCIVLSHNHPSGNTRPSDQDISLTRKVKNAASFMDLTVLDHIILTADSHTSMADEALMY